MKSLEKLLESIEEEKVIRDGNKEKSSKKKKSRWRKKIVEIDEKFMKKMNLSTIY